MIPYKIQNFLKQIIDETDSGNIVWKRECDDHYDSVSTKYRNILLVIADAMDDELGVPKMYVNIYNSKNGLSSSFSAYDGENGYISAKNAYSVAIASTIDLPFIQENNY